VGRSVPCAVTNSLFDPLLVGSVVWVSNIGSLFCVFDLQLVPGASVAPVLESM